MLTIKKRISDIPPVLYGYVVNGIQFLTEPSEDDIRRAIENDEIEERGYQSDYKELEIEWKQAHTREEADRQVRLYHARRIAFFVVNGWSDPIRLGTDGKIKDGLHRLKAATFQGMHEVEVHVDD